MVPGQTTGPVAKSPAPKSKASSAMVNADQSLVSINGMIVDIRTPISALVVDLNALSNQFINPGLNFCDDILRLCDSLNKALGLCKFLSPFPVIGDVIKVVTNVIEKMQIEKSVKKVVMEVKAMFTKARDTTMKPIVNASNKILNSLQTLSDKLQPCRQALATMTNLFDLIDLSVYVLFNKPTDNKPTDNKSTNNKPIDDFITNSLAPLEQTATKFGQQINTIQSSLTPLKTFAAGDTFKNFKKVIAGPLSNELAPLQRKVRELQNKMGPLVDSLTKATDKLGPVKWVIGKLDWLVNKTIQPIARFIIDNTPLKSAIDEVNKKIEEALGVTVLKEKVSKALGSTLESLQGVLTTLQTQAESAVPLFNAFTNELKGFREVPSTKLLEIVSKGLQVKYPQLFDQVSSQAALAGGKATMARIALEPMQQVVAPLQVDFDQHDVEHIDDYEDLELNIIEAQQLMMNKFVDNVEHELEDLARLQGIVIPASTVLTEPLLAPKLAYALCEGEAVSVFMRVDHNPVLEQLQANRLNDTLAPMPGIMPSSLTAAGPAANLSAGGGKELRKQVKVPVVSPTGGKVVNLDKFTAKCDTLSVVIEEAKARVNQIKAAAEQADALFASFPPDAGQFGDHLVNMLAQLEPMFSDSSKMLALPIKHRTALTTNLSNILKGSGAAASVTTQITAMFTTIDKAKTSITDVRKGLVNIATQSKAASDSYKAFFTQCTQVVAPSRFPKTLGPSVTNLTTLVGALQTRLDQAAGSLSSLVTAAIAITQIPDQLVDANGTYANLNGLFGQILPLIDPMVAQAKQIQPLVDTLYTALNGSFGDMQKLFTATQSIVLMCRKAEAQVVSADVFRGLCARIHSAVAPFNSFLTQLQVPAVPPPSTGKKSLMAAVAAPAAGTTPTPTPAPTPPGPPPPKVTPPTGPSPKSTTATVKVANAALGGAPFDIVTSLIGPKIFDAIDKKLDTFASIGEFVTPLADVNKLNQLTAKANLDKFSGAITSLVGALEPKIVAAADANAAAINPFLDQAKAQTLATVVQSIEKAMNGAFKAATV